MSWRPAVAVLAAVLGLAMPTNAPADTPPAQSLLRKGQPIPAQDLERFVDGAVRDAMAAEHIAGVSVAIVQSGRPVLLKGYGLADKTRPMDPDRTLVRIGSVSKTFVWVALLKEVERGRVRLADPVNDYLPPALKIPDQGFKAPIRVIDLMSHAAGFEDTARGHLFVYRDEDVTPLADYLARRRPRRVREPGQFATYSNYGAALAGYIVARLNGQDFETVMEREVFAPLGMASTTYREPYAPRRGLPEPMPRALSARLSDGFAWRDARFQVQPFEHISQIAPAGSASTTAADMARYMLALQNGGRLDGTELYGSFTAQALRTPILATPSGVNGWAHGLMVRDLPGGFRTYGHGGATGVFFTNMALIPDLDLGVFANSNSTGGRALVERLPELIVEHFYLPPRGSPLPGDPALARRGGLYAGDYIPTRRAYFGLEKFADLLGAEDRVWVTRDGYLIAKTGSITRAWVPDGDPSRFRAADGGSDRLVFKLDAQGRAVSFPIVRGSYTLERAGPMLDRTLFGRAGTATLAVALLVLAQRVFAGRRASPAPTWTGRVRAASLIAAGLWVAVFAAFKGFGLEDQGGTAWPGPEVLATSIAALAAAAASVALLAATPLAWMEANGEAWWLKGLQASAAPMFVIFSVLVAVRGGLSPWA